MARQLSLPGLALLLLLPISATAAAAETAQGHVAIATTKGERDFDVEVANDEQERARGLMFRRELPRNAGMLFDFAVEQPVGFWMHNTYIPLDMLFIKADGTVASIAERTTPLSDQTVPSNGPVRYVLEINGGLSRTLGIHVGDKVSGSAIGLQK